MGDAVGDVLALALEIGFEHVAPLDAATLRTRFDVREACVRNLCGHYGRNWACPPACGELHAFEARFRGYTRGVLVQTSLPIARDAGMAEMLAVGHRHGRRMRALASRLGEGAWALGGGECDVCPTCTLPDACRLPGARLTSMEAAGLDVAEVCDRNGLALDHGDGTLTWVGCVLVE